MLYEVITGLRRGTDYAVFSVLFCVVMLNGAYRGQKLTKLVRSNTNARTPSTQARAPVMVPLNTNTPRITAVMILTMRSAIPSYNFV